MPDPSAPDTPNTHVARLLTDTGATDALVSLFARIADEEGWQPSGELGAYRHRSVYFGLYDGSEPVGGLQVVLPDGSGTLPCLRVWPEHDFTGRSDVAHVAMLAVVQPVRGKQNAGPSPFLFWLLCVEMWRWCRTRGIAELWLEATPRTLGCYRRMGWPLAVRGPLREHWGEPCYLVSLNMEAVTQSVTAKARRSSTYRRILALAQESALDPA